MNISVILCTYNGEKYLRPQLDSLRAQTLPPCEVLIRDDGSSDATAALVRGYIREHRLDWSFAVNAANKGYRRNFRDGAAAARGDFVAFCDQDDVWRPDKLARLARVAEAHADACAVAGSFDLIDADGRPIPAPDPPGQAAHGMVRRALRPGELLRLRPNRRDAAMLLGGNIALGCALMIRRDVARVYAARDQLLLPHDWETALIAFLMGGVYFLNEPVLDYRLHGANVIGLPAGAVGTARRGPSLEGRLETMRRFEQALACAESLCAQLGRAPLDPAFRRYARLRRAALEEGGLVRWLRLQRCRDIYKGMFTRRQRLGDLLLALRGTRGGQRRGAPPS